ncbi:MAG: hypothetical protein AAF654_03610 [Myxococcota bacterium]
MALAVAFVAFLELFHLAHRVLVMVRVAYRVEGASQDRRVPIYSRTRHQAAAPGLALEQIRTKLRAVLGRNRHDKLAGTEVLNDCPEPLPVFVQAAFFVLRLKPELPERL